MNNNHQPPPDDLPNHLLAASTLITYRQRTRTRTLRRLALLILILAGLLLTYHLANAAPPPLGSISISLADSSQPQSPITNLQSLPPAPTHKPWPPPPPHIYYCHRGNPHPPAYCYRPNSRQPIRR